MDFDGSAEGTVLVRLSEILAQIRRRGLTSVECHAGERAIVDWFGATIAGSGLPPAMLLSEALCGEDTKGASRLVPSGRGLSERDAALINATASHTIELDDIFREGIFHPGSPVIAAALAVAERRGASGADFVRAVVIGYEAGCRIAEAVNPAHYRFWHTTGTVGTIAAAAAAAEVIGLSGDQMAHAMATATTMAAGLQQAFRSDSMSKPLHAGHAAEAGVLAALAAERGFTGALDVLEGGVGFGPAMAESPAWTTALQGGPSTLAIERITVKNHACCGHTFAAVDAALDLRSAGLRPDQVSSVEVRTYTTATRVAGYDRPATAFEAKFSIKYCVSAALVLGGVRPRAFESLALADPVIQECIGRVTVVADEDLEQDFPGQRKAVVTVRTTDGDELVAKRDTRRGDPDDPLSDADLTEKFLDVVQPTLGKRRAGELADQLWCVGGLSRVRTDLVMGTPALP